VLGIPEDNFSGLDAGFRDAAQGDYRLGDMSFLIDRGDSSQVLPGELDLDGRPRIAGASVDIAAFESVAASQGPVLTIFRLPDGRLRLSGQGRLQHSRSLLQPTWEDVLEDWEHGIVPDGAQGYWRLVQ
jgi:hypothetical protein